MQIEKLTVQNYRCIGRMTIDKLSPITVLVGRNNTGKSALLEAIALVSTAKSGWYDSLGDDLIEPILERRGGIEFADMMIKIGEQCAELKAEGRNIIETVQIAKSIDSLSGPLDSSIASKVTEYVDKVASDYARSLIREISDLPESMKDETRDEIYKEINSLGPSVWRAIKICLGYLDDRRQEIEYAVVLGEEWNEGLRRISRIVADRGMYARRIPGEDTIRSSKQGESNTIFLLDPTVQYLKELQRRLARSGELLKLIEKMREKISYFSDIREVKNDFLVFIKGLDRPVPLAAMGDGFRAKLAILSAISTVEKGVVLMEEPETRLHPGYMSSVVSEIGKTAALGNLQFIVSTHSLEFLELMLEANAELVNIVRMYRLEDSAEIDYEVLAGKEALEDRRELELDLRGI